MTTAIATLTAATLAATATPLVIHGAATTSTRPLPRRWPTSIGVGVALAALAGILTWQRGPAVTGLCAPLLLLGVAAALVDIRECRLPDALAAALLAAALLAVGVHSIAQDDDPAMLRALAGLTTALAVTTTAKIIRPDAIGWGDVKLAPSLGAYLGHTGWHTLYTGLLAWWLLILLTAVLALASRRRSRTDPLPYGPAMITGTVIAIAAT